MPITTAQYADLLSYISGNNELNSEDFNQAGATTIAAALNEENDPETYVWEPNAAIMDLINANPKKDVVDIDTANSMTWDAVMKYGTLNLSDSSIRERVEGLWGSLGIDSDVIAAILAAGKRLGTVAEIAAFTDSEAEGDGSEESPYSLLHSGPISWQEVLACGDWT